jgi:hypothetical protein
MSGYLPPGCTQRECDEAQPGYWDEPDMDEPTELDLAYEDLAKAQALNADLLKALKDLLPLVENHQWGSRWPGRPHAQCDAAHVAIAKAEGQS